MVKQVRRKQRHLDMYTGLPDTDHGVTYRRIIRHPCLHIQNKSLSGNGTVITAHKHCYHYIFSWSLTYMYQDETVKAPTLSNFISHSLVCNTIPTAKLWAAFEAQNGKEDTRILRRPSQRKASMSF